MASLVIKDMPIMVGMGHPARVTSRERNTILKRITGTLNSLFSFLLLFYVHIVCREGGREGERETQ